MTAISMRGNSGVLNNGTHIGKLFVCLHASQNMIPVVSNEYDGRYNASFKTAKVLVYVSN